MQGRLAEIFRVYLRLGLTSFGGPVAHLGYFRQAFVHERGWLDERAYADLVALSQFLPGPSSSQVGFAVGLHRGGLAGACLASLAFTLPSAVIMIAVGLGLSAAGISPLTPLFAGFKAAAVAVVAWAVWGMGRALCTDRVTLGIAVVGCALVLALPGLAGQLGAIAAGAVAGALLARPQAASKNETAPALRSGVGRGVAIAAAVLFAGLLAGLPLLAALSDNSATDLGASLYRSGALVFGGGHVVLPLLQAAVVDPGLVDGDRFLAGYGIAQALPGPLFTFGGFVGASAGGLGLALLATVAIFLPGFLLVLAVMPAWARLRGNAAVRRPLTGVNAAVVGLLAGALIDPVLPQGIGGVGDAVIALAALAALAWGRVPVWLIVGACGLAALGLSAV